MNSNDLINKIALWSNRIDLTGDIDIFPISHKHASGHSTKLFRLTNGDSVKVRGAVKFARDNMKKTGILK